MRCYLYSDEYKEGYQAYQYGLTLIDNPYSFESEENEDWLDGWYQAAEDDGEEQWPPPKQL